MIGQPLDITESGQHTTFALRNESKQFPWNIPCHNIVLKRWKVVTSIIFNNF